MYQIPLPLHITVAGVPAPHTHSVTVEMEDGSHLTIVWPTREADLRVITVEAGPDRSVLTIYENMVEADICFRDLALELEDWVEYEEGIRHAAEILERREAHILAG